MWDCYREIITADFEFRGDDGDQPIPICYVAHELKSGRKHRVWLWGNPPAAPPHSTGSDVLFVAYFASAELNCFRVLGWPIPQRILDPYVEFRAQTCGLKRPFGSSLLGVLAYHGLDGIGAEEKKYWRDLIRSGERLDEQREGILSYCEGDVDALDRLLAEMAKHIDLPHALIRGRYMAAVSAMEHAGVPMDVARWQEVTACWEDMLDVLITEINDHYHFPVYDGRTLHYERFRQLIAHLGIPWPLREDGMPSMEDDTFREMAKIYPVISPLRELRAMLSGLKLRSFTIGQDGRNRVLLAPFTSKTGRNQPSNANFVFGSAVWSRGFIQPPPGHAVAYLDWCQQEFGIAASLSRDTNMMAAYRTGDPYLAFAKMAGAVPQDATKKSHKAVRDLYKQSCLATQYGQEADSIALKLNIPRAMAVTLLRAHRETFRRFWQFSDAALDFVMLNGYTTTTLGWTQYVADDPNPRSLRNFLMQANGAEMLRVACMLGTEAGIEICAPVHDAVLICAPSDRIDADVARMQNYMREASRIILGGFELETEISGPPSRDGVVRPIRHPSRPLQPFRKDLVIRFCRHY